MDSSRSGQMNLLEEILDSLSTTTGEQGRLSAAKSLDFFRSMDDLDYKAPVRSTDKGRHGYERDSQPLQVVQDLKERSSIKLMGVFLLFQSKPAPASKSKPADESGCDGGGDQGGWNMGQDDSAVHGKHLPPSPRRQPNKSSLKLTKKPATTSAVPISASTPPAREADSSRSRPQQLGRDPHLLPPGRHPRDRLSYSPSASHRVTPTAPSPTLSHTYSSPAPGSQASYSPEPAARSRTISDPQGNAEPPQAQSPAASTSILRRKVLSKETVRHYQEKALQRKGSKAHQEGQGSAPSLSPSALQVPWEKEVSKEGLMGLGLCLGQGKGSGAAAVQDQGLLEEIESMCCLGSVLHTSMQLSQVHCNNSPQQVQSKATDES